MRLDERQIAMHSQTTGRWRTHSSSVAGRKADHGNDRAWKARRAMMPAGLHRWIEGAGQDVIVVARSGRSCEILKSACLTVAISGSRLEEILE